MEESIKIWDKLVEQVRAGGNDEDLRQLLGGRSLLLTRAARAIRNEWVDRVYLIRPEYGDTLLSKLRDRGLTPAGGDFERAILSAETGPAEVELRIVTREYVEKKNPARATANMLANLALQIPDDQLPFDHVVAALGTRFVGENGDRYAVAAGGATIRYYWLGKDGSSFGSRDDRFLITV